MMTCKDKYGDFAGICDPDYQCELYDDHEHCPEYRRYMAHRRQLKVASDSKQGKLTDASE